MARPLPSYLALACALVALILGFLAGRVDVPRNATGSRSAGPMATEPAVAPKTEGERLSPRMPERETLHERRFEVTPADAILAASLTRPDSV
jgi:hypothetical protein